MDDERKIQNLLNLKLLLDLVQVDVFSASSGKSHHSSKIVHVPFTFSISHWHFCELWAVTWSGKMVSECFGKFWDIEVKILYEPWLIEAAQTPDVAVQSLNFFIVYFISELFWKCIPSKNLVFRGMCIFSLQCEIRLFESVKACKVLLSWCVTRDFRDLGQFLAVTFSCLYTAIATGNT